MKLAVIGGGGVRSMFLAKSIAEKAEKLNISELVLMDDDPLKLRIYGGMAKEVSKRVFPKLKVYLTESAVEAVKDADYVITTIRVGGDEMRVQEERIALDLGVIGQETTGAAGFSFAMRSVPVLVKYCELIKKHAKPGVKVFNFTNPAGVVSQALRDAGYDFTYGICDAPSGMLAQFAVFLDASPSDMSGECYGANHLSFFKSIKCKDREVMQELLNSEAAKKNTDLRYFEDDLLRLLGCVPNEYLYYFYSKEKAFENISKAKMTRGELIAYVNKNMTEELSSLDPKKDFERCIETFEKWHGHRESMYMAEETGINRGIPFRFDIHAPEKGGYAGVALKFIEFKETKTAGDMILCVPNNGAIDGIDDDAVVEVTCRIENGEAHPHRMTDLPKLNMSLIKRVKDYEQFAAYAVLHKDKNAAVSALMCHPLVGSYDVAAALVEKYIKHNEKYIVG